MTAPRITPKTCGNCRHFDRRDPALPWPRAGVSFGADGTCARPSVEKRREWRAETDRCDQWAKIPRDGPARAGTAIEATLRAEPAPVHHLIEEKLLRRIHEQLACDLQLMAESCCILEDGAPRPGTLSSGQDYVAELLGLIRDLEAATAPIPVSPAWLRDVIDGRMVL